MRTALLLPNPSASRFTGAAFRGVLSSLAEHFDVHAEWADGPTEVARLARDAAHAGTDVVLAMGGDGVVHHAANGLVGTDTPLGIIPAGTTNVVAKIHGIPQSAIKAARAVSGYAVRRRTMARIVSTTARGDLVRHAVFAFGIGFDADVVELAEKRPYSKLNFGSLHYARSTIAEVLGPYRKRQPNLRVSVDGVTSTAIAIMVQVLHPYTYFGRVPLQITKEPTRGLTAVAIGELGPWAAMTLARRAVISRSLSGAPDCSVFTDFAGLRATAEPGVLHQADGELLGTGTAFEVTPAVDALCVLAPS